VLVQNARSNYTFINQLVVIIVIVHPLSVFSFFLAHVASM
jgi:hypothetical protein